jgi:curved DNA-binding protein CbpA
MHPSLLPYHPERDVYRLLQLDDSASSEEVSVACRRLARRFHPDHNRSPRANEEMGVVNAVRDMLTDPAERAAYDRARSRFLTGWTPGVRHAQRRAVAPPAEAVATEDDDGGRSGWLRRRALPAVVERTLRALVAAFRAALGMLGPSYCPTCGALADASHLFCGDCGTRLRRVRRLSVE